MKLGQEVWVAVDSHGELASCPEGLLISVSRKVVEDEIDMWSFMLDKDDLTLTEVTIKELEWDESW